MSSTSELTIDPAAVADAASRVDDLAQSWHRSSAVLATLLLGADEPGTAALLLNDAATALVQLGAEARKMVADVLLMEAGAGPLGLEGVVQRRIRKLHGVTDREATDAAEIAWVTFGQGDTAGFTEINQRFCSDPRYAAALAAHVSAHRLAEQLIALRDRLPAAGIPGVDRDLASATAGLLRTLGAASVVGALPFEFSELHEALDQEQGSLDPNRAMLTGLAFLPAGVRWGAEFVADAARQVVVPMNDLALRTGDAPVAMFSGQSTIGPINDARVLILRAVALSPLAASELVREVGFDRLASARLGYSDSGAAMADVAIVATDPIIEGNAANARALFTWLDAEVPAVDGGPPRTQLPRQFHAALGGLVSPWLGAFRDEAFAFETGLPNPLPDLPPAVSQNVLRLAAEEVESARLLTDGRLVWAAAAADDLLAVAIERGVPYDGEGLQELGHVVGRVDAARAWGDLRRASASDTATTETRDQFKSLATVMTVPFRRISNTFGFLASAEAGRFIDNNTAPSAALEHTADGLITGFANDAQTAKAVVLSRLMRAGDQIGLDPHGGLDGLPATMVRPSANGGWMMVPPSFNVAEANAEFEGWLASDPAGTTGLRTMLALVGNGHATVGDVS